MDAHPEDLDEWLARLPKPSAAEQFAAIDAARRAAAEAPIPELSIIPSPDFPYSFTGPRSGTVRFRCSIGCGWFHDERPDLEEWRPPPVPLDPEKASRVLSEYAAERAEQRRRRIEAAFEDHFERSHPGR
ncbi:hypothetical protein [Streptomyces sp. BSE6.1]|uniref:hypothetical protein n=1 Tax=Streptomyces sp. BSE6.1 TaxID=2605730 RepID=UPI001F170DDA|nr:hypothetical protein [Streptomyces sp. BSE6.1]